MSDSELTENKHDILIVETDPERGHLLEKTLQFVRFSAEVVNPDELEQLDQDVLQKYAAIFSIDSDELKKHFLRINKSINGQLPVVVLADKKQLDEQTITVHIPYISALCYEADYFSLSQVLDHARIHNRRERRHTNRDIPRLIGKSVSTQRISKMIEQVADSSATVLIMGESGTGKEVIARKIHALSNRSKKPFVPINCGAIPAELLESELFGHEKGAFTGAINARQGRFELAEGGVIFLDEIGDMPLPMQVKILRVLQENTYERVGSNQTRKTNVRVIAATHQPLEELIREGRFREDLFYRLHVFPIDVAPLRERREDIPLLIDELIRRIEKDSRGSVRLTRQAVSMLQHYDWPGNVRELANLIERLAILYPHDVVDVRGLPEKYVVDKSLLENAEPLFNEIMKNEENTEVQLPKQGVDLKQLLADIEVSLINQSLEESNHVVARAADLLNIRRTTLVEKMRKFGIER